MATFSCRIKDTYSAVAHNNNHLYFKSYLNTFSTLFSKYFKGSSSHWYLAVDFLYFIYPIPKVAFLPVFMLMFGLGNTSKIILMVWIIVFQIILSIRDGIKHIDNIYFKVMDSYLVNRKQRIRYLILPAILPNLFTGLRMSIGIALASLFFAENYATTYGIGYYVLSAWTKMNYIEMFSGILVLGFVGILLFKILDYIEVCLTPWQ
ncbi:MAG: hypothetical protein CVU95_14870 [Firmicutes bacterium HGW-Firmicutes-2]|nr:MAG: hypothetical protein CVU95_14870 [Firmicutes bacterium HGW-Firmicutes-2]